MAEEYKALTYVNLPLINDGEGKHFAPGDMIAREDFDDWAEAAAKTFPDSDQLDAEGIIAYYTEWGTISDDPEAELHPDHQPVDPNELTVSKMIAQAQWLVEKLEEEGKPVPDEVRLLAETVHVVAGDHGSGGGESAA